MGTETIKLNLLDDWQYHVLAKIIHMYMLTTIRFFCIVLLKGGNV